MHETTVTLIGNVATEVRFRETPAGIPVASFRLASTARRWDRARGVWVDAHTSFYTVWAWRWLAENVAGSVAKGDPLIVRGRVRVSEWERDGRRHTTVEIEAEAVGHDLSRGTSAFRRGVRARTEEAGGRQPRVEDVSAVRSPVVSIGNSSAERVSERVPGVSPGSSKRRGSSQGAARQPVTAS